MSDPVTIHGVSFDGTTCTAAWRSGAGDVWQSFSVPCDATPGAVAFAFAEIAREVRDTSVSLRVTLVRPLANACTVAFPRMARAALEGVLTRDWSRYVIGLRRTPHVAAVRWTRGRQWRAAFAPLETLEAIAHAASIHGWRDVVVQTGDDALASAIAGSGASSGEFAVVCDATGVTDVVYAVGREPLVGRRLVTGMGKDAVLAFARSATSRDARGTLVSILGPQVHAGAVAAALAQCGFRTRVVEVAAPPSTGTQAMMAIVGTLGTALLELRSPTVRAARAQNMRGVARWLYGACAAALLVAYGIERVGVTTEMTAIRTERAELSGPVRRAMADRSDVEQKVEMASRLARYEAAGVDRTSVIAAIAVTLPSGAELTALTIVGDSVSIEGGGARGAAVYDALRTVPQLQAVRLAAPIRQERTAGDAITERFSFIARVRSNTAPRVRLP